MNINDFCIQRHLKLWEEQNKVIKRLVLGTVLFSILLLLKVLTPFSEITEKTRPVMEQMTHLEETKRQAEAQDQNLTKFDTTLEDVRKTIQARPWVKEKDELIRTLRNIRHRSPGGGTSKEYQQTADATIRTISDLLREEILAPLEATQPVRGPRPLSSQIEDLRKFVTVWEQGYLGRRWYGTLSEKDAAIYELTQSLDGRLYEFASVLRSEQLRITTDRKRLEELRGALENDIDREAEKLKELDKRMQRILPQWIQGLLTIEEMVQLFPVILLMLVLYVFGTALFLTRHYEYAMDRIDLSERERKNRSASSIWTLTDRGHLGSTLTISVYLAFIAATWIFFEWGCLILGEWLATDGKGAWISSERGFQALQWIGRTALFSVIWYLVLQPVFAKKTEVKEA